MEPVVKVNALTLSISKLANEEVGTLTVLYPPATAEAE